MPGRSPGAGSPRSKRKGRSSRCTATRRPSRARTARAAGRLLSPLADCGRRTGRSSRPTRRARCRRSRRRSSRRRAGGRRPRRFPTYSDLTAFSRSAARARARRARASSSSARSSRTRTSTASPRPGGASRARCPTRRSSIVGNGSRREVIDRLVADLPGQVEHHPELAPAEVAAAARPRAGARAALVARGARPRRARGVRARPDASSRTDAGGIPDIVDRRRRRDPDPAAPTRPRSTAALRRILEDHELAVRLGAAARAAYARLAPDGRRTSRDAYSRARRPGARRARGEARLRHAGRSTRAIPSLAQTRRSRRGARGAGRRARRRLPRGRWRPRCRRTSRCGRSTHARSSAAASPSSARSRRSLGGADAVLVHMVPHVRAARGAADAKARSDSACCSGTRTGTRAGRCALRRASATRRSASIASSYPIDSPKVRGIGHAIDVDVFAARAARRARRAAARCSRSAAPRAGRGSGRCSTPSRWRSTGGLDATLEIRGPSLTRRRARAPRGARARDRGDDRCAPRVRIEPAVARAEIAGAARGASTSSSARTSRDRARRSTRPSTRPRRARGRCHDEPRAGAVPRRPAAAAARARRATPAPSPTSLLRRRGRRRRGSGGRRGRAAAPRRGRPFARPLGGSGDRRSSERYDRGVSRSVLDDGPRLDADTAAVVEDVRSSRPYLLSRSSRSSVRPSHGQRRDSRDDRHRRAGPRALRGARASRALFEPKPVLWGLLWTNETNWLAFLILLLVLVFWQARLYAPREVRERRRPGRAVACSSSRRSSLAFAIGTGQHFTTFGLYVVGAVFVSVADRAAPRELRDDHRDRAERGRRPPPRGARRRRRAARAPARVARCAAAAASTTSSSTRSSPAARSSACSRPTPLDELIVADAGLSEERLLEIVDAAHRRGVKVRIAPRTTELLVERGEYVPGSGRAALRAAPADLRRGRLGDEARVRHRRRRS